ncbi:eukaryotic translation initiation factor 5 [Coemansia javaensis]|uniref:Eukaryotic translation initiation factor 5 n=1 Tax=Coemansia javaensis TaxID=2761396 RepID=A0A9W8LH07_9FUNG|nr:eukaryotic translation initiation factor 5 [Coemansia javaensis]
MASNTNNINIRRSVNDPFYRYKMPRLISKVEGRGNGIKTALPNIVDVARALSRPPEYPTRYFGNELGAQVKADSKADKFIVNGAHDAEKLQTLLDGFIDRFVLCGSCENPETDLIITKDQMIIRRCMACGNTSDVDMRHRLTSYILKNPPPKSKKGGQHAAGGAAKSGDGSGSGGGGGSGNDLAALVGSTAQMGLSDDGSDWDCDGAVVVDDSLGGPLAQKDGGDDDSGDGGAGAEDEKDPFDQLGDFIGEGGHDDAAIFAKARELDLDSNHRALVVVIQCVLEESTTLVKDIGRHEKLLKQFGTSDKHQRAVIGGFERLISANPDALLAKTPAVLKALFDREIVSEEVLLDWGKKPSKKYVERDDAKKIHKAAQPFLEWLETAEEETESESE